VCNLHGGKYFNILSGEIMKNLARKNDLNSIVVKLIILKRQILFYDAVLWNISFSVVSYDV
jgi:hypothetical protein